MSEAKAINQSHKDSNQASQQPPILSLPNDPFGLVINYSDAWSILQLTRTPLLRAKALSHIHRIANERIPLSIPINYTPHPNELNLLLRCAYIDELVVDLKQSILSSTGELFRGSQVAADMETFTENVHDLFDNLDLDNVHPYYKMLCLYYRNKAELFDTLSSHIINPTWSQLCQSERPDTILLTHANQLKAFQYQNHPEDQQNNLQRLQISRFHNFFTQSMALPEGVQCRLGDVTYTRNLCTTFDHVFNLFINHFTAKPEFTDKHVEVLTALFKIVLDQYYLRYPHSKTLQAYLPTFKQKFETMHTRMFYALSKRADFIDSLKQHVEISQEHFLKHRLSYFDYDSMIPACIRPDNSFSSTVRSALSQGLSHSLLELVHDTSQDSWPAYLFYLFISYSVTGFVINITDSAIESRSGLSTLDLCRSTGISFFRSAQSAVGTVAQSLHPTSTDTPDQEYDGMVSGPKGMG